MPNKTGSRERLYGFRNQVKTNAEKMELRPRSRAEYHTSRWTRESKAFKQQNPLCKRCKEKGFIRQTEVTDHVVPVEIHGDFWDVTNWQPLCRLCNIEKGNEDKKQINEYRKRN